ncbi:MAG: hypothetical protein IPL78_11700 [Chloroflexi bacterium]|nr:hypothetical protein [Chloroflexota bacterium]
MKSQPGQVHALPYNYPPLSRLYQMVDGSNTPSVPGAHMTTFRWVYTTFMNGSMGITRL